MVFKPWHGGLDREEIPQPPIPSEAKISPTVILSGVGAGREAKDLKLRGGR